MLKELVKVANKLDEVGLTKEADIIDFVMKKSAQNIISLASDEDSQTYVLLYSNYFTGETEVMTFNTKEEAEAVKYDGYHHMGPYGDYSFVMTLEQYEQMCGRR